MKFHDGIFENTTEEGDTVKPEITEDEYPSDYIHQELNKIGNCGPSLMARAFAGGLIRTMPDNSAMYIDLSEIVTPGNIKLNETEQEAYNSLAEKGIVIVKDMVGDTANIRVLTFDIFANYYLKLTEVQKHNIENLLKEQWRTVIFMGDEDEFDDLDFDSDEDFDDYES